MTEKEKTIKNKINASSIRTNSLLHLYNHLKITLLIN